MCFKINMICLVFLQIILLSPSAVFADFTCSKYLSYIERYEEAESGGVRDDAAISLLHSFERLVVAYMLGFVDAQSNAYSADLISRGRLRASLMKYCTSSQSNNSHPIKAFFEGGEMVAFGGDADAGLTMNCKDFSNLFARASVYWMIKETGDSKMEKAFANELQGFRIEDFTLLNSSIDHYLKGAIHSRPSQGVAGSANDVYILCDANPEKSLRSILIWLIDNKPESIK